MTFSPEHIGLAARDPHKLKDWYVATLGTKVVYSDGKMPPAFLIALPGGFMIEIYAATSSLLQTGDNLLAGWRHLALRVESIEAAKAELEKRGVQFTDPI